jgi:hypothetical protein
MAPQERQRHFEKSFRRLVGVGDSSISCEDNDRMWQRVEYRVGSRGHDQWLGGSHRTILTTTLAVCADRAHCERSDPGKTLDLEAT